MRNFKYIVKKNDNETDLNYNFRKIFIEEFKPKNVKDFKLIEMYSNIFINIISLKCNYEKKTEKKINLFIKRIKNY